MKQEIHQALRAVAKPERVEKLQSFFKTGKGEYAEGDVFLGVYVPELRKLAKKYCDISLADLQHFISSDIHEERLFALLVLVLKYKNGDNEKAIYDFYIENIAHINNWDLIDTTAEHIVGAYLEERDKAILYELAKSDNLWKRRIAMVSCFFYIRKNRFDTALNIADMLVNDEHDLIHKAVGWMLREIGKRDLAAEEGFLNRHYQHMPRTMLRYAIEKFTPEKRHFYMGK